MLDLEAVAREIMEYAERGDPVKDVCEKYGIEPDRILTMLAREYLSELRIKERA